MRKGFVGLTQLRLGGNVHRFCPRRLAACRVALASRQLGTSDAREPGSQNVV